MAILFTQQPFLKVHFESFCWAENPTYRLLNVFGFHPTNVRKCRQNRNHTKWQKLVIWINGANNYILHSCGKYQWINKKVFPKGTDLDTISEEQIAYVGDWINNQPMKIIHYMTPKQKLQYFGVAIASWMWGERVR